MSEEMSRRDFLKMAGGAVAAAGGLAAETADAQEISKSLAKPELGMFGDGQGFSSEYIKRYESWFKTLVENPKIKPEIARAAQLPVSLEKTDEYKYAEVIFTANSGLPKNLIIADDSEKIIMHINRVWSRSWGTLADGEVVMVAETYVNPQLADKYKSKGLTLDGSDGRVLKTSIVYNTKTKAFRTIR